jgi:glycosyltransferase involved in cell wall biosynthesis
MKIAFLAPAYPLRGGIVQFISLMADSLSSENEVKVFSFKRQYPKIIFPGKDQLDHEPNRYSFPINSTLIPYNPLTWFKAINEINEFSPDILILKYWIPFFAPSFGFILRRLERKIKKVAVIDNIDFHEKWLMGELLTKYALKKVNLLVAMSENVLKNAKDLLPKNKCILSFHPNYQCYDFNRFTKEKAKKELGFLNKKVILFFGYIKQYKGLDILLKAFKLLVDKNDEFRLLIVGEVYGDDKIYLNLIKDLEISEKLVFIHRFAENTEIEKYFKAADLLSLPYKHATQSGVLKIADSFLLGAVGTPVGGIPEMIENGKTGIISKSCSAKDFSKAISDFFLIDEKIIKNNIKKKNEKFSWTEFDKLIFENL